ncbi:MAG: hypothetical protein ACLP1D_28205, partial [Xanthobacteraceae bacterium]
MSTEQVRAALTRARRKFEREKIVDPEPGFPLVVDGEEIAPGQWTPDLWGMPPLCPVQPIGGDENCWYFQDEMGQFVTIPRKELGATMIQSLFAGRPNYPYWAWPRFRERKKVRGTAEIEVYGWHAEKVRETLFAAAARHGPFNKVDRVRGLGAWRGRDGDLVWNGGNVLYRSSHQKKRRDGTIDYPPLPGGMLEGYFYTRRPDVLEPWPEAVDDAENPAKALLIALRSWNWERPEVDPILMLGWIVGALIGGALDWRASCFVIGGHGTGKSQLQKLIETVFNEALVRSPDATAASIYQHVKNDSVPVAID